MRSLWCNTVVIFLLVRGVLSSRVDGHNVDQGERNTQIQQSTSSSEDLLILTSFYDYPSSTESVVAPFTASSAHSLGHSLAVSLSGHQIDTNMRLTTSKLQLTSLIRSASTQESTKYPIESVSVISPTLSSSQPVEAVPDTSGVRNSPSTSTTTTLSVVSESVPSSMTTSGEVRSSSQAVEAVPDTTTLSVVSETVRSSPSSTTNSGEVSSSPQHSIPTTTLELRSSSGTSLPTSSSSSSPVETTSSSSMVSSGPSLTTTMSTTLTRGPQTTTLVSSSVSLSHTALPSPSTTVPPTTPPSKATFNYKLILYVVPPLLVVVVLVVIIALALCAKRYRRIRRYRQHLVPLTDVDGSDDSDEEEELDTREPAFMVASTNLSSRPILSFDES